MPPPTVDEVISRYHAERAASPESLVETGLGDTDPQLLAAVVEILALLHARTGLQVPLGESVRDAVAIHNRIVAQVPDPAERRGAMRLVLAEYQAKVAEEALKRGGKPPSQGGGSAKS